MILHRAAIPPESKRTNGRVESGYTVEIIFVRGEDSKEFTTHGFPLSNHSDRLQYVLNEVNQTSEDQDPIELKGIDIEAFGIFVQCLYTGSIYTVEHTLDESEDVENVELDREYDRISQVVGFRRGLEECSPGAVAGGCRSGGTMPAQGRGCLRLPRGRR